MAEFWRFIGLALASAVMALILRESHPAFGTVFSLLAGVALLLMLSGRLAEAAQTLRELAAYALLQEEQTALILKLLGVSFAAELAAQACRDAGENGLAMRIEMGARLLLLLLCAPLLRQMAAFIVEMTA